jgi:hypothetical protein
LQFALQKVGLLHALRFSDKGRKLEAADEAYYTTARSQTAGPV